MRMRRRSSPALPWLVPVLAALVVGTAGCDRPPSADGLREWSPTDHDRSDEKEKLQSGTQAAGTRGGGQAGGAQAAGGGGAANSAMQLVEATWKTQCSRCHGPVGHGDGPEGPMVKATDLTSEEWQAKVQDPEIAASIKNGKNKMPKFELPDQVIVGLVMRIRASKGR
jgi:mono/diheme cytochrome c family protein